MNKRSSQSFSVAAHQTAFPRIAAHRRTLNKKENCKYIISRIFVTTHLIQFNDERFG